MTGPTPVVSYRVEVVCEYQGDTMLFAVTDAAEGHPVDVTEPFRAYLRAFFSGKNYPGVVDLGDGRAFARIGLTAHHGRLFWPA
jgi:hypothetical protein